jgi:hypothetical protein
MMIRNQKSFFPTHIYKIIIICFCCIQSKIIMVKNVNVWFKRRKFFLCVYWLVYCIIYIVIYFTQCSKSLCWSACHLRVWKEYLGPITSAWKKVYFLIVISSYTTSIQKTTYSKLWEFTC